MKRTLITVFSHIKFAVGLTNYSRHGGPVICTDSLQKFIFLSTAFLYVRRQVTGKLNPSSHKLNLLQK